MNDNKRLQDIHPVFSAPPRATPRKPSGGLEFSSTRCDYKINIFQPTWTILRHVIPIVGAESPFHPDKAKEKEWQAALKDPYNNTCHLDKLLSSREDELTQSNQYLANKYGAKHADKDCIEIRIRILSEILGIRLRIMNQAIIDCCNTALETAQCDKEVKCFPQQSTLFTHHLKKIESLLTPWGNSFLEWPGSIRLVSLNKSEKVPLITEFYYKIAFPKDETDEQTTLYGSIKLSSDEASTYLPSPIPSFEVPIAEPEKWYKLQCLQAKLDSSMCDVISLSAQLGEILEETVSDKSTNDLPLSVQRATDSARHQVENLQTVIRSLTFKEEEQGTLSVGFRPPTASRFDTYCLAVNYAINLYAEGHGPGPGDCEETKQSPVATRDLTQTVKPEPIADETDPSSSSSAYFTPPPPSSN